MLVFRASKVKWSLRSSENLYRITLNNGARVKKTNVTLHNVQNKSGEGEKVPTTNCKKTV